MEDDACFDDDHLCWFEAEPAVTAEWTAGHDDAAVDAIGFDIDMHGWVIEVFGVVRVHGQLFHPHAFECVVIVIADEAASIGELAIEFAAFVIGVEQFVDPAPIFDGVEV